MADAGFEDSVASAEEPAHSALGAASMSALELSNIGDTRGRRRSPAGQDAALADCPVWSGGGRACGRAHVSEPADRARISRNIARPIDNGVNAIARYANRLGQLILADADFFEKFPLQNFARTRICEVAP